MRRAFVSHSTTDDGYVAEMESFLRAAGFDEVFNDVSSIKPDEEFWPTIERGITNCDTLIVVITSASIDSEWVKREVECARKLKKSIIPVWIEDCPVPPTFEDRDVIDFRPRTRKVFIVPLTERLRAFRFRLIMAMIAGLLIAAPMVWRIAELTPHVRQLEEAAKKAKGNLVKAEADLQDLRNRTVCVVDSDNRKEVIGTICAAVSRSTEQGLLVVDREPISVGGDFSKAKTTAQIETTAKKTVADAAKNFANQVAELCERSPAVVIVHWHALRPHWVQTELVNKNRPDPSTDEQEKSLLNALRPLANMDRPPNIILYSRSFSAKTEAEKQNILGVLDKVAGVTEQEKDNFRKLVAVFRLEDPIPTGADNSIAMLVAETLKTRKKEEELGAN